MTYYCSTHRGSHRLSRLSLIILLAFLSYVQGNIRNIRASENCATKFQVFPGHTACLAKSAAATSVDMTSQEETSILDLHNKLRAEVRPSPINMLKMSWDAETAMVAKRWAETCQQGVLKNNELNHDKNQHRFIPARFSVGQNLAWGYPDFAAATQAWYDEYKDYPYGTAKYQIKTTKMIGHYTQLVWANTYKLGCAKAKCEGIRGLVYVCNYGPAGNVGNFKTPYESGGSSSCQKVTKGLCDCGSLECQNEAPLHSNNCTCDCTPQNFLDANCKFSCKFNDTRYCGSNNWGKSDCYGIYATSVTRKCPHQCQVCPYALPGNTDKPPSGDNGSNPTLISTMAMSVSLINCIYRTYKASLIM